MGKLGLSALAAVAMIATSGALRAQELVFSSWLPPKHPIVVDAFEPWADEVEKVTDGRVSVRILPKPLGSPPSHFDLAKDGVADITYGVFGFSSDERFIASRVGEFSLLGGNAIETSKAFWTVYTEMLGAREALEGTHILGLYTTRPGNLILKGKNVSELKDLAGLKIRAPGGYAAEIVGALGASPVSMPSSEIYEALSRGVVDGAGFTYEGVSSFKLSDHAKYIIDVPGGIYNATWFFVVNQSAWDNISPEDQAAIDAISGLAFAERIGQVWEAADAKAIPFLTEQGTSIQEAPQDIIDAARTFSQQAEAEWASKVPQYDALGALAKYRELTGAAK